MEISFSIIFRIIINFIVIIIGIYMYCIRSNFPIHMLQLEGYDNEEYKNWLKENKNKVFKLWYGKNKNEKTPLVLTDRAKRLFKTHYKVNFLFLLLIEIIVFHFYINKNLNILIPVTLNGALLFILYFVQYKVVILSNKLALPRELKINQGFFNSAQNKIKELKKKNLKVVGITGSFGKTSVKFISNTVLSEGFRVKNTPSSFNTPMGLSKIINNELDETYEIFIAELGAKKKGEIEEVANLVSPDIGVITAIGPTHMHLFKTIENIMDTKYELIESLPNDGIAIFNYDNEYVRVLADKTTKKTIRYGTCDFDKLDIYAKDIKVSEIGSSFKLVIKNFGEIDCETKLLGVHNISNLLAAASIGYVLGLSLEKIRDGIKKVEGVEHRLNLIPSPTGSLVIDDAFNSNPVGFRAALDVLGNFKTRQKIIVTPGMVELGDIEEKENYEIAKEIAKVCDYVILVGKNRTEPIYRGLKDINFDENKVIVVSSLDEATIELAKINTPNSVVLFENDLPDSYSEE